MTYFHKCRSLNNAHLRVLASNLIALGIYIPIIFFFLSSVSSVAYSLVFHIAITQHSIRIPSYLTNNYPILLILNAKWVRMDWWIFVTLSCRSYRSNCKESWYDRWRSRITYIYLPYTFYPEIPTGSEITPVKPRGIASALNSRVPNTIE